ncbi:Gfo/Idh/MocA family protein [Streptomyces sp. NPDC051567]|uniref:Gfo/Idh/MocA family protein n=1 Tax=Streptomyces sp. NPDC051567 TaxID=3365660 RepID=UPI0037B0410F
MTRPVRVGVMGAAGIARRRLLPALASCPGTEVAAVASRSARTAADLARTYGCRAVRGYEPLLDDDDVDAVYIPLPAALHATWVEAALRAGKHVLAEKPLTSSAPSTARLLELARSLGLVLMENVMFVHHPQHAEVRRLVTAGAIGAPRLFHARFTVPRLPPDDIRYRSDLGGGALLDTGVYPVRAALHLLGPGLTVVGAALTRAGGFTVDTSGAALLTTPEGVLAQLSFGLDHGYGSSYELVGSEGRIGLEHAFTPPRDHRPVLRLSRGADTEQIRLPAADQVARTVAAFAQEVRSGRRGTLTEARDEVTLLQAGLLDRIRSTGVVRPPRDRSALTPAEAGASASRQAA